MRRNDRIASCNRSDEQLVIRQHRNIAEIRRYIEQKPSRAFERNEILPAAEDARRSVGRWVEDDKLLVSVHTGDRAVGKPSVRVGEVERTTANAVELPDD